jgi:hypothetical protein
MWIALHRRRLATSVKTHECDLVDAGRKRSPLTNFDFLAFNSFALPKHYGYHNPSHENEIADPICARPENVWR